MSYYARLRVSLDASLYSDYGRPDSAAHETTYTPDEWVLNRRVDCATAGETITTNLGTCTTFIVKNDDATNYVTLAYTNTAAASNSIIVAAGRTAVIPDLDPGQTITITANTLPVTCLLSFLGT
jgi:hypothetical protein